MTPHSDTPSEGLLDEASYQALVADFARAHEERLAQYRELEAAGEVFDFSGRDEPGPPFPRVHGGSGISGTMEPPAH